MREGTACAKIVMKGIACSLENRKKVTMMNPRGGSSSGKGNEAGKWADSKEQVTSCQTIAE